MAWAMRNAAKRVCYSIAHSNAMNGISVNTEMERLTPWWQTALLAAKIITTLGLAASLAWCALSASRKKRQNKG